VTVFAGLLAFAGATLLLAMSPGPASVLVMRQTLYGGQRMAALSILGIASGLIAWVASAAIGLTALISDSHESYQVFRGVGAVVLAGLGLRTLLRSRRTKNAVAGTSNGAVSNPAVSKPAVLNRAVSGGGMSDGGVSDGGVSDGGVSDGGVSDGGVSDGGVSDGGVSDGGVSDGRELPAAGSQVAGTGARPWAAYQAGLFTCLSNPKVAIFAAALLPQFVSARMWSGWVALAYALVWASTSSSWYVFLTVVLRRARWIYERPTVRRRLEQLSGLVLLGFGIRLATLTGS
jgi:threonine/homoserine/homoserine lactone efflux protein